LNEMYAYVERGFDGTAPVKQGSTPSGAAEKLCAPGRSSPAAAKAGPRAG
jgi:hypothetical protein